MIIDTHTHNYKEGNKDFTVDDLLKSMDEAGIDYSLLIADSAVGGTSTEAAVKISSENPRLKAIGCVEFKTFGDEQLKELKRYLMEGKIYGVKLYPPYEEYSLSDPVLFPLYEEMQRIQKPIIIHTGFMMSGLPGLLKQSQPLNIDEVANKFPNLKIVMAHFGNPWLTDAMMVMVKNKNVYADISGYFEGYQRIQQKDITFFIQDLTYIKNYLGNFKRFIFATDWPLYSQKEYLEAAKQLPLTEEEKDLVFWKNANELFNLKV